MTTDVTNGDFILRRELPQRKSTSASAPKTVCDLIPSIMSCRWQNPEHGGHLLMRNLARVNQELNAQSDALIVILIARTEVMSRVGEFCHAVQDTLRLPKFVSPSYYCLLASLKSQSLCDPIRPQVAFN